MGFNKQKHDLFHFRNFVFGIYGVNLCSVFMFSSVLLFCDSELPDETSHFMKFLFEVDNFFCSFSFHKDMFPTGG